MINFDRESFQQNRFRRILVRNRFRVNSLEM